MDEAATTASGSSAAGGYQGVVTGTIAVTPGQVLTIAVGSRAVRPAEPGTGNANPANYTAGAAAGGPNPLGYNGGNGGVAGYQGTPATAAAGGAATVVTIGGATIVAGGSGGAGGSGQFAPTLGRVPYSTFTGRTDTTSRPPARPASRSASSATRTGSASCDGGGGGGGGGGAVGGAQGDVQFGSGTSNEWYGYGGYPGQNSTAGVSGLSACYQYYPDNSADGCVDDLLRHRCPGCPDRRRRRRRRRLGRAQLDRPERQSASPPSPTTSCSTRSPRPRRAGPRSPTASRLRRPPRSTGLTDGTAYIFQVSAVNTVGQGCLRRLDVRDARSGPAALRPSPSVTAQDGALLVGVHGAELGQRTDPTTSTNSTAAAHWVTGVTTTSPLQIAGLTNGTLYSVADPCGQRRR